MQDFTLYYLFKKMQPNALLIQQNFIIHKKWVLQIVLLVLCNLPCRGINSRPNLGRSDECTPLCGFLAVVRSASGHEVE
jgi:hypothetical protein